MNITNSNLNFNAQYIDKVDVKKKNFLRYEPYQVSLIEFDKENPIDRNAIGKVVSECGTRSPIFTILWSKASSSQHVVGLTTQENNFENPDPDKILSLMQYYKYDDYVFISKLQVKPEYKHKTMNLFRKYKDIGKSFIEKIKCINENKRVEVYSLSSAMPFYEKIGFKHDNDNYKSQSMYLD